MTPNILFVIIRSYLILHTKCTSRPHRAGSTR